MKDKPENPKAFPFDTRYTNEFGTGGDFNEGLSLRDYFAAKAIEKVESLDPKTIAILTGRIADAMLAERSKSDE